MRVLVAYGSKMGGTKGLAEMVGSELETNGFQVDVMPASAVADLAPYGAIIVGGALYSLRWHKDARRFMRKHSVALQTKPTWLFSSGPLDDSAPKQEIPPVRFVKKAMLQTHARGHMTFGGRMPADAKGFPAGSMAKNSAGDWRDPDHVRMWAKQLAEDLHAG
ncbi:MAG: flavodoxin domain-containing protein [Acidimicrobiia bacterium]